MKKNDEMKEVGNDLFICLLYEIGRGGRSEKSIF